MKSFGLSTRGIKGVDGMKAKCREYLKDLEGSSKRKVGETFQVLLESCKTDAYKRGILCKLYEEAVEFFQQLDKDFIMQNLQESLRDFKSTLEENLKNIKPRDQYVVLVAGETSAGKSSIINLILGEDLLPYSILSTTSTIYELKYGEKPAIGVHFKDGSGESREPFYQELGHSSASYKEEIEEFVHLKDEREKGSPYKKIELFWPHPLFKNTKVGLCVPSGA
ncbi:dynamin-like protein 2 [Oculina patagonica]